jgi:hypothetical protein
MCGCVVVWCVQLTANARSQLTYTMRGRVNSVAVLDSSHSVVCGNDQGAVHVFKVEYVNKQEDSAQQTRYAGMSTVRNFDDTAEGAVLAVNHFNTLTESLVVYGTMRGRVHGYDLRAKHESFNLAVEPALGLLSAMAVGPTPFCVVAGTTRGFVVLWDLRFQVPVQIWRHNARSRIVSITPQEYPHVVPAKRLPPMTFGRDGKPQHQMHGPLMFIAAEGTNEVVGFDVFTGECRLVFRVLTPLKPTTATATASASASASANPTSAAAAAAAADAKAKPKATITPVTGTLAAATAAGAAAGSTGLARAPSTLTEADAKTVKYANPPLPSLRYATALCFHFIKVILYPFAALLTRCVALFGLVLTCVRRTDCRDWTISLCVS